MYTGMATEAESDKDQRIVETDIESHAECRMSHMYGELIYIQECVYGTLRHRAVPTLHNAHVLSHFIFDEHCMYLSA